jgi:hypothetical protein
MLSVYRPYFKHPLIITGITKASNNKLRGFSLPAKYTDRATAACQRNGLVVRVPGYRSRGPGFDSRHYQIF